MVIAVSVFEKTPCSICGFKYRKFFKANCPNCDGIDFENILFCRIEKTEQTYRTEIEYEWKYYYEDGKRDFHLYPVEYKVEDGLIYTFLIVYDASDKVEVRAYHESNVICKKLLAKVGNDLLTESFDEVKDALSNLFSSSETEASPDPEKRKEQSVKEARSILECFGSSYENMIIALERDLKFSHEEAVYGADNCGADWKEEALRAARKCLEKNGEYSFEKMVFQLQIFNFTQEEAEDAAKQLKLLPDEDPEKWHHHGSYQITQGTCKQGPCFLSFFCKKVAIPPSMI